MDEAPIWPLTSWDVLSPSLEVMPNDLPPEAIATSPTPDVMATNQTPVAMAMASSLIPEVMANNAFGNALNPFHEAFVSTCKSLGLHPSPDSVSDISNEGLRNLTRHLVSAIQDFLVSLSLTSNSGLGALFGDLSQLQPWIDSEEFEPECFLPLLRHTLSREPDESLFEEIYLALMATTPPPRSPQTAAQTPTTHNSGSVYNSNENRGQMDKLLKEELGAFYIGIPDFYEVFFSQIPEQDLKEIAESVFHKCKQGGDPIYDEIVGWRTWPRNAQEKDVLTWLSGQVSIFRDFALQFDSTPKPERALLVRPNQPLQGSTAARKLDVGFVKCSVDNPNSKIHWANVLVPGELKSNADLDRHSSTWLDLARYVREVFATQTRRYVLGFTLCGSIMRLWEFDRAGGIASNPFDINKDGLQFVSVVLGYLLMDAEHLGFDPTILEIEGKKYIDIKRDGQDERFILDSVYQQPCCIAGRATTCWRAFREGDTHGAPFSIKDSWQYSERDPEGIVLQEITASAAANVARHYHHEIVQVAGRTHDVRTIIRRGLDISNAENYNSSSWKMGSSELALISSISSSVRKATHHLIPRNSSDRGRNVTSATGGKRPSSSVDLRPRKRQGASLPSEQIPAFRNRVHHRLIVRDCGKPLYKASSRAELLAALEECIKGYESLYSKTGILHRDISIGNLMIKEDGSNHSPWPAFLIDFDLAIKESRLEPSGAGGKTGTKVFMAIRALMGDQHTFTHDLESFFWVLLWICIHYHPGPDNESRVVPKFERWNFDTLMELSEKKSAVVSDAYFFINVNEYFTDYYKPLVPYLNELRNIVFPNGLARTEPDRNMATQMREVLRRASQDPVVLQEV